MAVITISENTGSDFTGITDVKIRQLNNTGNFNTQGLGVSKWASGDHELTLLDPSVGLDNLTGPITVNSVLLRLFASNAFNVSSQTISAYRVLLAWAHDQATWDERLTGTAWNAGGARDAADRTSSPVATLSSITSPFGYLEWSGAALNLAVQNYVNGVLSLLSFAFDRDDAGNDNSFIAFTDSEGTDGQRPELVVDYTVGSGGGGSAAALVHYYSQLSRR
jgi:hypothetical protein